MSFEIGLHDLGVSLVQAEQLLLPSVSLLLAGAFLKR